MTKIQKAVRWEPWIKRAIDALAKEKKKNFSWMANYLIGSKLSDYGLSQKDFEPDMEDLESRTNPKKAVGQEAV